MITPDQFGNKKDYQFALEDEAEKCKSYALKLVESLWASSCNVPDFKEIDRYLKFAEGSIKKARKIIKIELQSRMVNLERQKQKMEREMKQHAND